MALSKTYEDSELNMTGDEYTEKAQLMNKQSVPSSNEGGPRSRKGSASATNFVEKNKFGLKDESDEEDEDILALAADKTPRTRRKVIKEENVKKVKKLGPVATAFTLFKGFVAMGILYMPKNFTDGGYGFSGISVILALILTLYCAKLLIEVYDKVGGSGGSLPEIGF